MVDCVRKWSEKTDISLRTILPWAGIYSGTFCKWTRHYGQAYEHNAKIPRDHWLTPEEQLAIVRFHDAHPLNGYRRLTYMMLDADVVACSATSVYRVLHKHGLLNRFSRKASRKGTGFEQPLGPNEHWHIDVSYINICGTFYFCATILDGFSRMIVHWDIRETMKEIDIEAILQRARELHPEAKPRIISDNGPQFIANDFKSFIRISGMTHVRTSPYYPQSNGKVERYHKTMKSECIRPETPLTLKDALRSMTRFVERYNKERLHSGIGYVTPWDMFQGRRQQIHAARDAKLEAARARRAELREARRKPTNCVLSSDSQPASASAPHDDTPHDNAATMSYTGHVDTEDRALLGTNPSAASTPLTGVGA